MYICTKFQKRKKLRYLTVMVISNRPLRFIIATLVACLPLMSFANPEVDSVKVHTEVAHETTEQSHEGAHAEPTDVKSKIKAFIGHHVLDSHDFTFLSDDSRRKNIMVFLYRVILWDNGLHLLFIF